VYIVQGGGNEEPTKGNKFPSEEEDQGCRRKAIMTSGGGMKKKGVVDHWQREKTQGGLSMILLAEKKPRYENSNGTFKVSNQGEEGFKKGGRAP